MRQTLTTTLALVLLAAPVGAAELPLVENFDEGPWGGPPPSADALVLDSGWFEMVERFAFHVGIPSQHGVLVLHTPGQLARPSAAWTFDAVARGRLRVAFSFTPSTLVPGEIAFVGGRADVPEVARVAMTPDGFVEVNGVKLGRFESRHPNRVQMLIDVDRRRIRARLDDGEHRDVPWFGDSRDVRIFGLKMDRVDNPNYPQGYERVAFDRLEIRPFDISDVALTPRD